MLYNTYSINITDFEVYNSCSTNWYQSWGVTILIPPYQQIQRVQSTGDQLFQSLRWFPIPIPSTGRCFTILFHKLEEILMCFPILILPIGRDPEQFSNTHFTIWTLLSSPIKGYLSQWGIWLACCHLARLSLYGERVFSENCPYLPVGHYYVQHWLELPTSSLPQLSKLFIYIFVNCNLFLKTLPENRLESFNLSVSVVSLFTDIKRFKILLENDLVMVYNLRK
jgi:hypothetical protein